jgi:hypothetical protein
MGVTEVEVANEVIDVVRRQSFIARTVGRFWRRARGDEKKFQTQVTGVLVEHADSTAPSSQTEGWLLRLKHETSLGVFIRDLV